MNSQEVLNLLNVTMGLGEIIAAERWIFKSIDGQKLMTSNNDELRELGVDSEKHR